MGGDFLILISYMITSLEGKEALSVLKLVLGRSL